MDWLTRDHRLKTIENMSNDHLLNSIRYARRHEGFRPEHFKRLQEVRKQRGLEEKPV